MSEFPTPTSVPLFGLEKHKISAEVSATLTKQSWFNSILKRLSELLSLGENWNGYGEKPIQENAVKKAIAVLDTVYQKGPVPEVVPTPDGGVQLEWEKNGYEIEIEIPSVGPALILVVNSSGQDEEITSGENSEVWGYVRDLLKEIRGRVD